VRPSKPSIKEICGEGRSDSSQVCDVLTDLCGAEYYPVAAQQTAADGDVGWI